MRCKNRELVKMEFCGGLFTRRSKQFLKDISKEEVKIIIEFDKSNKSNGNSIVTRKNCIGFMFKFAKNIKKPLGTIIKKDIDDFLVNYDGGTLENHKMHLKKFYAWMEKSELTNHLKTSIVEEKYTSEDMWTEEEINKLLQVVDPRSKERDQAILMLMYDLAVEKKVIHNLNISDIIDDGNTMKIKIVRKKRGKIKTRILECILSSSYVRAWLNQHPDRFNPNAPLFITYASNWFGNRLSEGYPWSLLQKLRKRAGIPKKICPHLIRHSKATDLYRKGFRGIPLQKFLGHSSILMQQRYSHLCCDDINDERFKIETGIQRVNKNDQKKIFVDISCPRCEVMNNKSKF